MTWLIEFFLNLLLGRRITRETSAYLSDLSTTSVKKFRRSSDQLLDKFRASKLAKCLLGTTAWHSCVEIPLNYMTRGFSLITGATGAGKSMAALLIIKQLIEQLSEHVGFGVLDAKGELFLGTLWLLKARLEQLARVNPEAAKALRRRIVIIDFSARDPISTYNLLAQPENADAEFFALSRADLIIDLLEGDKLSFGAVAVLQRILMLLAEFRLPITWVFDVIEDCRLRYRLLSASKNAALVRYFNLQFEAVPKSTLAAIERRMDAFTASESVRTVLNGASAPDLRLLQDQSRIVLINCFGENIARSVRRLLQALVLSDIRQAVFARRTKHNSFLWICDEAQNFFISSQLRDNMHDLLTMARSFGSFFLYLTQNMSTAVGDARFLRVLYTNLAWALCLRGDPEDCEFLAPALPVTGRKVKPRSSPFEERTFYTEKEERRLLLDNISQLPNRTGYLWLKSQGAQALKISTADLVMPQGSELEVATQSIRRDTTVGWRVSRKTFERQVEERDQRWRSDSDTDDLTETLSAAYRKSRGSRDQ